jgi:hypothetical protein
VLENKTEALRFGFFIGYHATRANRTNLITQSRYANMDFAKARLRAASTTGSAYKS